MYRQPPEMSWWERIRFHSNYLLPVVVRGALVARRFGMSALKLHCDPIDLRFFTQMRRKYSTGLLAGYANNPPVKFDRTVVALDLDLIQEVLDDDAGNYEVADVNYKVIERFAPGTLIISDPPKRHHLREFATHQDRLATDTSIGQHKLAPEFLGIIAADVVKFKTHRLLKWKDFASLAATITTQTVLGAHGGNTDLVAQDKRLIRLLTKLVYTATCFIGWRSFAYGRYYELLRKRIKENKGSGLIGNFSAKHMSDAQASYWMMALKDGLDTHLPRALALILAHPEVYDQVIEEINNADLSNPQDIDGHLPLLEGCVHEALRLWTGTPLLNRKRKKDGLLGKFWIGAGTQVLIPAAFFHRDPAVFGNYANSFSPQQWQKRQVPPTIHFSLGPRGCAGREMALFLIKATLAHLLKDTRLILRTPELQTHGRIPALSNQFKIRVERTTIPVTKNNEKPQPDFIVVGSGAGGGPLAANLAKAGYKVVLVEAGGDQSHNVTSQAPLFHTRASEHRDMAWNYTVHHYNDRARRKRDRKHYEDPKNKTDGVWYPRAGTLGGCTVHNAMICTYPDNEDWRRIQNETGDNSWAPRKMRAYFMRLENCNYVRWLTPIGRTLAWILNTRHGFGGWLHVTSPIPFRLVKDTTLLRVIYEAAQRAFKTNRFGRIGFVRVLKAVRHILFGGIDINSWWRVLSRPGGIVLTPINVGKGHRSSPRDLINRARREYPNRLTVLTDALVSEVILEPQTGKDASWRATGIKYFEHGGALYEAVADFESTKRSHAENELRPDRACELKVREGGEVILAAGAFNTPQILMLSGIGPKNELEKHGIRVRHPLPGVGKNLQDRYETTVVSELKEDLRILKGLTLNETKPDPLLVDWHIRRRGLYTTSGAAVALTKHSSACNQDDPPDLFIFGTPAYFEGYEHGYSRNVRHNCLTWVILKGHTENHAGYVRLRSAKPYEMPEVNFRYFDEGSDGWEEDLNAVFDGLKLAREINRDPDIAGLTKCELLPGDRLETDDELKGFIKDNAWGHHASCTCAMGPAENKNAVVDSKFRVHGIDGLRIVDASVFPRIPGLFIVCAIYMISEKAFDVIKEAHRRGR